MLSLCEKQAYLAKECNVEGKEETAERGKTEKTRRNKRKEAQRR